MHTVGTRHGQTVYYLAILGSVYDVTEGEYYAPGGGYEFFSGFANYLVNVVSNKFCVSRRLLPVTGESGEMPAVHLFPETFLEMDSLTISLA